MPRGGYISAKPGTRTLEGGYRKRVKNAAAEGKERPARGKPAPRSVPLGAWMEAQLGELSMGSAGAAKVDRVRTRECECCEEARAPAQLDLQPEPDQDLREAELGQRVLPANALGPVTPFHKLSARERNRGIQGMKYDDGPHYAWLDKEQEEEPAPVQGWSKSEAPPSPATVIDSAIGLQDEPAKIVIIGGGPHALAALASLKEDSLQTEDAGSRASCRPAARAQGTALALTSHCRLTRRIRPGVSYHRDLRGRSWFALHAGVEHSLRRPGDQPPALACNRSPHGLRPYRASRLCH